MEKGHYLNLSSSSSLLLLLLLLLIFYRTLPIANPKQIMPVKEDVHSVFFLAELLISSLFIFATNGTVKERPCA